MTGHTVDQRLRERAQAVIPGGMYGHQSTALLPAAYPQFMRGGRGARIWDVDGNEYVDLMCSYGPVVLGHKHPRVEKAVAAQAALADCQNAPGPVMVDLAELLVRTVRHADWAMFAKNGTDATTMCCTIARARTGRSKVLVASGAYHGSAPWCTWPASWSARSSTTQVTTRSLSIPSSPAACARCATPPGPR
jgi:glutamate-1-semialdehyde 2,1-aminomutase